ncbi:MAG: DUF5946 family protein, partial [Thermoanaerobaculia bacterium]
RAAAMPPLSGAMNDVLCPGCGLVMPRDARAPKDGYYDCSAECWSVYTEVLAKEYGNAVPPMLQQLASRTRSWPHFDPPADRGPLTVFDVAVAADHAGAVRAWATQVWAAWSAHHAAIADFARVSR